MSEWHINPYPPRAQPKDWTGEFVPSGELKLHDFYRIGRITITVRHSDFCAHIDNNTAKWGCGKSVLEAIGDLVISHHEILQGPPMLCEAAAHLVDEADLDGSTGSYCEVSRDTIAELKAALEAK